MRRLPSRALVVATVAAAWTAAPPPAAAQEKREPTAAELIARRDRETSPVWADGDTATFFFRGDAEQVVLLVGGDHQMMRRLPNSDVWTATYAKPGLAKGVFTYVILPGKKGESYSGRKLPFAAWRGPQAPPAATILKDGELMGTIKVVPFESKSLGAKREIRVYLPPGHDPAKRYPVLYETDGRDEGGLVEPLITSGRLPPMVVVAAASGGYLGERAAPGSKLDMERDLRSLEYIPGINKELHDKHEKFFIEEMIPWAEREFGASSDRATRGVAGCSNGGQFALDMGLRRPDLFGHVFAFSKAGLRTFDIPEPKAAALPYFHLAAGEWEVFYQGTLTVVAELKRKNVPHTFVSRVAGHDSTMWGEELANALVRAWGKRTPGRSGGVSTPEGRLKAIKKERADAYAALNRAFDEAKKQGLVGKPNPKLAEEFELFKRTQDGGLRAATALAEAVADTPVALDAAAWVLDFPEALSLPNTGRLLQIVLDRHAASGDPALLRALCSRLSSYLDTPKFADAAEKILVIAIASHPDRGVKGEAAFTLAFGDYSRYYHAESKPGPELPGLAKRAEASLETVAKKYGDVSSGGRSLADRVKPYLDEIRNLGIGRPAPDAAGVDLDGKPFKLSDYKGKVVVLNFWASGCGPCLQMLPGERKLVERLAGKPFALVGVNGDEDAATARETVAREKITWRTVYDGPGVQGAIAKGWNVRGWPTIYVIDPEGVIRYKHVRGDALDKAVHDLLKAAK